MAKTDEYKGFERTMRRLISVPHSKIKAKLDAEKAATKRKRKAPSLFLSFPVPRSAFTKLELYPAEKGTIFAQTESPLIPERDD